MALNIGNTATYRQEALESYFIPDTSREATQKLAMTAVSLLLYALVDWCLPIGFGKTKPIRIFTAEPAEVAEAKEETYVSCFPVMICTQNPLSDLCGLCG